MPIDCTGNLTADIAFDCGNTAVGGIEQNVVLINRSDVDWAATTYDVTNPLLVTNLALKTGAKGYSLKGVKQTNGKSWELVKKENSPDKFKQTFSGVIFNPSAENKIQASQLALGAKYVVVVEQIWKGDDSKDAFEVLGLDYGLEISSMNNNSKENDNMILFELSSPDGYEEKTMPKNLLETDYATTKTAFNNKFDGGA